jgi:hypothetical protein
MSGPDAAGLVGVLMILIAYGGGALGKLDPTRPPALLLNLAGASLLLLSLAFDFNLSAVVMESLWALIAVAGLVRLGLGRKP